MITSLYAGLLGLIFIFLSGRVVLMRGKSHVMFGDNGDDRMVRAVRIQGNFAEYVPLALLMMLLYEMQAGSMYTVHALGIALLVGRIAHVIGLNSNVLPARGLGVLLTFGVIVVLSVILVLKGIRMMQVV